MSEQQTPEPEAETDAEGAEVVWPPEADEPSEEPAESLEDDGTPGTGSES
jgi:hypothetical protein